MWSDTFPAECFVHYALLRRASALASRREIDRQTDSDHGVKTKPRCLNQLRFGLRSAKSFYLCHVSSNAASSDIFSTSLLNLNVHFVLWALWGAEKFQRTVSLAFARRPAVLEMRFPSLATLTIPTLHPDIHLGRSHIKKRRWSDTKQCTTLEPSRKQEERKTEK